MKLSLFLFCLLLGLTACQSADQSAKAESPDDNEQPMIIAEHLDAPAFAKSIQDNKAYQLIDVRTPEEWEGGILSNATCINWKGSTFEQDVKQLDKQKPTYVYCASGRRSSAAMEKLHSLGFTQVYNMSGGIHAWQDASLPTVAYKQ